MPIYSYMCNSCGHEFDELVSGNDHGSLMDCPHECGRTATRIPSRPAQAKGSFGTVPKKNVVGITKFNFKKEKKDA